MNQENCRVKKLDDYVIEKADIIKIDVEGWEYKVLEGGLNFIKKHRPYLLIEVGWGTNHPNWEECLLQYNKLFEMGYKQCVFDDTTQDVLFEPY